MSTEWHVVSFLRENYIKILKNVDDMILRQQKLERLPQLIDWAWVCHRNKVKNFKIQ